MQENRTFIWDRIIHIFFLELVFVFFSNGFTHYLGNIFGTDGLAFTWLILHSIILIMFLIKYQSIKLLYFKSHVWLLIFMCFISTTWATDSIITLRRCVLLSSTTFLGIYLADHYKLHEVLRLIIFLVGFLLGLQLK
jgi:uncharacterized membrane protein